MSDCPNTPYERDTSPYASAGKKYTQKASPYSSVGAKYTKTDSPYSGQIFCPALLMEDGWGLLQENGDKILLG